MRFSAALIYPAKPEDMNLGTDDLYRAARRALERVTAGEADPGEFLSERPDVVLDFIVREEGHSEDEVLFIPLGYRRIGHERGYHPKDTEYCARLLAEYVRQVWGFRVEDPIIVQGDPNDFSVFRDVESVLKNLSERSELRGSEVYAVLDTDTYLEWAVRLIGASLWREFHAVRVEGEEIKTEPSPLILPAKIMKDVLTEHGLFEVAANIAEQFSAYDDSAEPDYLRARDCELNFNYDEALEKYRRVVRSARLERLRHDARRRLRRLERTRDDPLARITHHMQVILESARYQWIRGEYGDFILRMTMFHENYAQAAYAVLHRTLADGPVEDTDPEHLARLMADLLESDEELRDEVLRGLHDGDSESVLRELRGEEGRGRAVLTFLLLVPKVVSAAIRLRRVKEDVFGPIMDRLKALSCSKLRELRHAFVHQGRGVSRRDVDRIIKEMSRSTRRELRSVGDLLEYLREGIDAIERAVREGEE